MAKFDIAKALNEMSQETNVINEMLNIDEQPLQPIPYQHIEFGEWSLYHIDKDEIQSLVESLLSVGLEQNLVVKESDTPNHYTVVSGHRRLTAIRYIFDNHLEVPPKVLLSLQKPNCIIIPKEENEAITRFRMHETNMQARHDFTLAEVEDYYKTIEALKENGIEINGQKIKGKSRELIKNFFKISEGTAQQYMAIIKSDDDKLKEKLQAGEMSVNQAYDSLMTTKRKKDTDDMLAVFKKDLKKSFNQFQKLIKELAKNEELQKMMISDNQTVLDFSTESLKPIFESYQEAIEKAG